MKALRALGLALAAVFGWLRTRGIRRRERIVPEGEPSRRAESAIVLLLFAVAGCGIAFIVVYAADWSHATQLFGLTLGAAFALLAAALLLVANRLVVSEDEEEDYGPEERPDEQEKLVQIGVESGSRITRKRLLGGAAASAGAALGAALVAPAASLGPILDTTPLYDSPWRRGRRLVDDTERPYRVEDISADTFYTAYPEDADPEALGSPLVVVRVDPESLRLPPERADWAPHGIIAFSKICTHAGCAVSIYRRPLYAPTSPRPALVCPCHYSTFDPAEGGNVVFGPAGRSLPQLPLMVVGEGVLSAAGDFSAPVGPSFWGVRTRRPL